VTGLLKFPRLVFFSLVFLLSFFPLQKARAEAGFSDAVIAVSVGTVAGAVLGASTLPFYADPGSHTKNIFYGAALGAMVGVLASAYVGVKESPNGVYGAATNPSSLPLNEAPELRLQSDAKSTVLRAPSGSLENAVAWSPLAQFRF
jgi:hypothetical protein